MTLSTNEVWTEMLRLLYECGEVDATGTRDLLRRYRQALLGRQQINRQEVRAHSMRSRLSRKKKPI